MISDVGPDHKDMTPSFVPRMSEVSLICIQYIVLALHKSNANLFHYACVTIKVMRRCDRITLQGSFNASGLFRNWDMIFVGYMQSGKHWLQTKCRRQQFPNSPSMNYFLFRLVN